MLIAYLMIITASWFYAMAVMENPRFAWGDQQGHGSLKPTT